MKKILVFLTISSLLSTITNAQTCNTGKLDPRIESLLKNTIRDLEPKLSKVSVEQIENDRTKTDSVYPQKDVTWIRTDQNVPLLVFNAMHQKDLRVLIYYHPGGFVTPLLPGMEPALWRASRDFQAIVVAVDYRIAPEHRFPAAVDDAYHAFKWIAENAGQFGGDTSKLIVWGLSAGGNLAAVVCQKAKRDGISAKIRLQILNCPPLDDVRNSSRNATYQKFAKGYFLTKEFMFFSNSVYAGEKNYSNPEVSPLLSADVSGLPPALIITAEFDILRDENELYARKLKDAGVRVWTKCFPGQIHCLVGLPPDANEILELNKIMSEAIAETFSD